MCGQESTCRCPNLGIALILGSQKITMHTEYRILEIRRGHVLAQPLDGVRPESLKTAATSKYIENEVIVAESLASGAGGTPRLDVIAARIDPSFIGDMVPKLVPAGEEDEYEFTQYVGFEEGEAF